MAWNDENKQSAINLILDCISSGQSLKSIIDERSREEVPAYSTFMLWISEDKELSDKYVCACEERAIKLFEEILDIADDNSRDTTTSEDGREVPNTEFIARSRLRVDARKWYLSKVNPKKYGDRNIISGDPDNPLQTKTTIEWGGNKIDV